MSSYAGENLFASGPHAFRYGSWQREMLRRGFPGVDGEVILDMGLRSRQIVQTGRLQAVSAAALHTLIEAVNTYFDGASGVLVDNYGHSFPRVVMEGFQTTTPIRQGRGFYCDYEVLYRQLP